MTEPRTSDQTGSALVFVLWMSILLSVILAGILVLGQNQVRLTRIRQSEMQAELVLRSALDLAAFDTALVGRSFVSSLPLDYRVDGQTVRVSLAPEHGRLDINLANDADWENVFAAVGLSESEGRRLAAQILDWRDTDTQPRQFGLEAYPEDGAKQIGNRPFLSVAELGQVQAMSPGLLACLTPYLTVFGGTPPPQLDILDREDINRTDGLRVAYRAEYENHQLTGLARFGDSPRLPFQWVAFGTDRPDLQACARAQGGLT